MLVLPATHPDIPAGNRSKSGVRRRTVGNDHFLRLVPILAAQAKLDILYQLLNTRHSSFEKLFFSADSSLSFLSHPELVFDLLEAFLNGFQPTLQFTMVRTLFLSG